MPVDPELNALFQSMAIPDGPIDWTNIRAEREATFRAFYANCRAPAVATVEDVQITGLAGNIDLRVYRPVAPASRSTLLFIHGGGWTVGGLDEMDYSMRRLCHDLAVVIVSTSYRLAPENPFPAAYEDALAAAVWTIDHADSLGGDPSAVSIAGDSAGGNLAAAVTIGLREKDDIALGLASGLTERPSIRSQLLFYPCTDFRPSARSWPSRQRDSDPALKGAVMEQTMDAYIQGGDRFNRRVSPAVADLQGLPDATVVVVAVDPLRDEAVDYADRLRTAGVAVKLIEFDNMAHGFLHFSGTIPAASAALDEVVQVFRSSLEAN